jgi:hypothetical protein
MTAVFEVRVRASYAFTHVAPVVIRKPRAPQVT